MKNKKLKLILNLGTLAILALVVYSSRHDLSNVISELYDANLLLLLLLIPLQLLNYHPSAVDAMTSPNQDYVIIQEAFRIYLYRMQAGVMEEEPARIIQIGQFDRLVMGEWATGVMAKEWLEAFQKAELLNTNE